MSEVDLQKHHRQFAVSAFNSCWELIGLPERTVEQDREMIRRAEVSFWHWMQYTEHTRENEAIGLWQLARVYALAGQVEVALLFAGKYADLVHREQLGAFHEGYALEAMARAHAVAGDRSACTKALEEAKALLPAIQDSESRTMLEADLEQLANQR